MDERQTEQRRSAQSRPGPVVVGVDGHAAGEAALAYGIHAALALRAPLLLVYADEAAPHGGPATTLVSFTGAELARRQILDGAVEHARRLTHEAVPVTGRLQRGPSARCLVADSGGASLLVIGRHERNGVASVLSRSPSARIAARAHCPVVVVPTGWEPGPSRPVTVGIDAPLRSHAVLAEALRLAAVQHLPLRVLNVGRGPQGERRRELVALAAREAGAVGGVDIEVDVRRETPSQALVEASRASSLLVVGRRDRIRGHDLRLGSVAGHVLRGAACPVALVPSERPRALHRGAEARLPRAVAS